MELLLTYAIPRRDVKPTATAMPTESGGLYASLDAPVERLRQIDGVGENAAVLIALVPRLLGRYQGDRWSLKGTANALRNAQDNAINTERFDANINVSRYLREPWFGLAAGEFLSSDEQQLALRSTYYLSVGRYLKRSNVREFLVFGGMGWTNERFQTEEQPDLNSAEGVLGAQYNAFRMFDGDLAFLIRFVVFPSVTEAGRVRITSENQLRWDLPKDLYFNISFTNNFDSRPKNRASKSDYVFSTGVGWSY
jgi:hypothetical protein